MEVLNLIIKGASNGEISDELFISENTVKFHVRNILKKTGCSNRTELLTRLNQLETGKRLGYFPSLCTLPDDYSIIVLSKLFSPYSRKNNILLNLFSYRF
ncbi:MAG: helix-turn-helix transcriptional regulator [Lachnospiraceae bacterium]|nr:helix-turn-helix transcriptional regulator [Lachnospiraceae bacterium]